MRRSFLARRIFTLLIVAVILWTVLTAVFYSFIARPVFTRIKANEVMPRAHVIADDIAGTDSYSTFVSNAVIMSRSLFNDWTFLVDKVGIKLHSPLPEGKEVFNQDLLNRVMDIHTQIMNGDAEYLYHTYKIAEIKSSFLFVAYPVQLDDIRYGSVIIAQPLDEMNAGIISLNLALLLSSLIILLIMTVPVIVAAMRIVRPLQNLRKVACAISNSDFTTVADENAAGEIGDLARAMNHLSSQLETTFSEFQKEKTRLRQILDGILEGIIAVDHMGKVTHSNASIWSVFGIKDKDPTGLSPDTFLKTSRLDNFFENAMTDKETVHVIMSKDHRQIDTIITPLLNELGIAVGAVGLFRDISESERLEMTRRDYVANISHELRTPLTAMRGLLEPLSEGMVKSETDRQRYYGILMRETLRLSRLINDMLELSRIQAKRTAILMMAFEPKQMLSDLLFRFQAGADEKEQTLTSNLTEFSEDLPYLWGNPDRVEQILIILLDNALKYTPQGGDISLNIYLHDNYLSVEVQNSGDGIRPEDLDHVFDRFFKADRAHNQPGTGLGLSIAKELADQMGYRLYVNSELNNGATFTLDIGYAANIAVTKDVEALEVDDDTQPEEAQDRDTSAPLDVSEENTADISEVGAESDEQEATEVPEETEDKASKENNKNGRSWLKKRKRNNLE